MTFSEPHKILLVVVGVMRTVCSAQSETGISILDESLSIQNDVGCQHNSTFGRDYRGRANTTVSGIPCQRWSDNLLEDQDYTQVGEHNYCRNPVESDSTDQVWCIANDTTLGTYYCDVPFCPPLKVIDFSLDGDWEPDANGSFTHASLWKENLPSSFTICAAFMVENWEDTNNSPLFLLLDNDGEEWLYVELYAGVGFIEFTINFASKIFSVKSPSLFFPMQWTRICFSFNSNTSLATLVVNGNQLVEKDIAVGKPPFNMTLILGNNGIDESAGRMTDVNVFSEPLSNMRETVSYTHLTLPTIYSV